MVGLLVVTIILDFSCSLSLSKNYLLSSPTTKEKEGKILHRKKRNNIYKKNPMVIGCKFLYQLYFDCVNIYDDDYDDDVENENDYYDGY